MSTNVPKMKLFASSIVKENDQRQDSEGLRVSSMRSRSASIKSRSLSLRSRSLSVRSANFRRSTRLSLMPVYSLEHKACQQVAIPQLGKIQYKQKIIPNELLVPNDFPIDSAQKWITLIGKNGKKHLFPIQTILPKVLMLRKVPPKQMPLEVAVERRRKQFEKVDFKQKLAEKGIDNEMLFPTEEQYYLLTENVFKHFLPISFFHNPESEHSIEGWLKLGYVEGEGNFPLPGQAFVPVDQSLLNYNWQYVSVRGYNEEKSKWIVMVLEDEHEYEVPSVQLRMLAESVNSYIENIETANKLRNDAECLLLMETVIDCRTLSTLTHGMKFSIRGIRKLINKMKYSHDEVFVKTLRRELFIIFEHLMACYEFEKYIKIMPKEFPDFDPILLRNSLPRAYKTVDVRSDIETVKDLYLNLEKIRRNVLKTFFYYTRAGIEAMTNVCTECQYIESLTIFVVNFSKALTLNEFLQAQQQQSSNVSLYLKDFWPLKLSSGVTIVLRPNGRGWLDITLNKWSVYEMCKISKFIFQIKMRMEASMHFLLKKSIEYFSFLLIEPCKQLLHVTQNYVWKSNYIITEFPFEKPIFSVVISVSDNAKVVYSTPPEDFRPALLEIFKKALEKTSGIRKIDAETMLNLRFAKNLYIQTVELIEDLYIYYDIKLHEAYSKAIIPLIAYSKLYERFIDFYLLNVNSFIEAYIRANKPSMQVKKDILDHKAQKEELRDILPPTIVIGPFIIQVDPMKQFLIKKHIEVVRRLFEYYINRMLDANQELLERCYVIYRRLTDRPNSIEHLLDTKEFALTVPELVEELRGDIQIMWLEYDLLDTFFYNLSDTQFAMKWEAYGWPHKILQRLPALKEAQKIDIEDFKRIHLSECIGFGERLESLNEEVQGFSLYFNPEKVQETSVEVKKVWKTIKDLQRQGDILSYRQKLFELEPLSMEFIESIVRGFTPYRTLWSTCAEVVKLEDATLGNPIALIDLDDVWATIAEYRRTLQECCEVFTEKPEVAAVAEYYIDRLVVFVPMYNTIKWLRNEYWLFLHWQELSTRAGIEIKYSPAINFSYLIKKGIMEHTELVHEISEKAELEANEIRKQAEEEERRQQDMLQAMLLRKAQRKCRRDIL